MKNSFIKNSVIIGLLSCAVCGMADARIEVPGRTDSPVNDYAGVINNGTRKFIIETNEKLAGLSRNKVEIIVSTFPSLEGWAFDEFSVAYGEKWRLSKKGRRDNGILILIVMDEQKFNVGVGQNLKGIVTPEMLEYIRQKVLVPNFSSGDYSRGVYITVYTLAEVLQSARIPETNYLLTGLLILLLFLAASVFAYKFFRGRSALGLLLIFFITSCVPLPKEDPKAKETVAEYLNLVSVDDYENSYALFHPWFKEKVSMQDYIAKEEELDASYGEIQSFDIGESEVLGRNDLNYEVFVTAENYDLFYRVRVKDMDGKWYIGGLSVVSEKPRTPSGE